MKKLILAICLALLSVGAYASNLPKPEENVINVTTLDVEKISTNVNSSLMLRFGCYNATSSCGVVWEICGDAPIEVHQMMWDAIDAACGTDIYYIEIRY